MFVDAGQTKKRMSHDGHGVVTIKKEASLETENHPALYCSLADNDQQKLPLKSQLGSALRNR